MIVLKIRVIKIMISCLSLFIEGKNNNLGKGWLRSWVQIPPSALSSFW
jgi:hypothetical protein